MSSTQPMHQPANDRPLRVLSLDAGGVHTLSTISMLMRLMSEFNKLRPETKDFEPWEVFDMIGGVETGGLLAIMLGRLCMSLDDCEAKFKGLCEKIYKPKGPNQQVQEPADPPKEPSKFDSDVLQQAFSELWGGPYKDWEGQYLRNNYLCKVFTAVRRWNGIGWHILPTYPRVDATANPNFAECQIEIWRACAATTASAGLFDPVPVSKWVEGLYYPNPLLTDPINFVGKEIKDQFPDRRNAPLISIGSGRRGNLTTTSQPADRIWVENFDLVHPSMKLAINNDNVFLDPIAEDDPNKWHEIAEGVTKYMSLNQAKEKFADCVGKLKLACP